MRRLSHDILGQMSTLVKKLYGYHKCGKTVWTIFKARIVIVGFSQVQLRHSKSWRRI